VRVRDLEGKTIAVTGANTGIGRVTALELAKRGARVVLACRSEEKTRPVLEEIAAAGGSASFLALDLADLGAVRRAADELASREERLDVLVNNAGLAGMRGVTKDGWEMAFGTNHLGPFLFTLRLLPLLRRSAPSRIVVVASRAHARLLRAPDWSSPSLREPTRSYTGWPEYQRSKLANVLFAKELARGKAGEGVRSYSVHPGVVASDVWRRMPWPVRPIAKAFMVTNEEGARTSIHCAASPEVADHDGLYYAECREKEPSTFARDAASAARLWEVSERAVAAFAG